MFRKINWGIVGPGNVAQSFMQASLASATGHVVAIGTRSPDRPGLPEAFPGVRIHGSYQALLADPALDAVYIATPHNFHSEWAIAAAQAGKHVLCEKPLGTSADEAQRMIEAASHAGTFLAEAYMYRSHPLTRRVLDIVAAGTLGEIRMIRSSFGSLAPRRAERLFSPDLAGGGILDVGGYPVTMACLIAAAALGSEEAEPRMVDGVLHIGETGVDEWAAATLAFEGGIVAQLSCSVALQQDNVLSVMGSKGRLEVEDFWFGTGKAGGTKTMRMIGIDGSTHPVAMFEPASAYSFQFEAANQAIAAGKQQLPFPSLTWSESLRTARILDKWLGGKRV